jgi:formylglycine-generating enzyme required for sulfatase activity
MMMVFIPRGIFIQGSSKEEIDLAFQECQAFWEGCTREWFEVEYPRHEVKLDPYWLDQTEVTVAMYLQCVAEGDCLEPAAEGYFVYSGYFSDPQYQDYPTIFVNWQDAQTYCSWAGRRLPTEAEWELAARGPEGWNYPWGNVNARSGLLNFRDINFAGDYLDQTVDDGYKRLAPVGSYPEGASYFGALDLAGNVREWVANWYQIYPGGDPSASENFGQSERVIRGGDYASLSSEVRSVYRFSAPPEETFWASLGFRCALTHSDEIADRYIEQQLTAPQATLAPIATASPGSATDQVPATSENVCQFIDIKAFPGYLSFISGEELPVFGYEAGGFSPGERVNVKLSGVSQGNGLSFTMDVTDLPYSNGKGLVDGILVWSEGIVKASIPSDLIISLDGTGCTLSMPVTWPYVDAQTTSEPGEVSTTDLLSIRDDFNATLDSEWTWIRADDHQWSLTSKPGKLEVSLTSTTQIDIEGSETLLLRWIEGNNFEIITRILFEPQRNFQRVGLVIYENRNNYVALLRGHADISMLPGNALYFENRYESEANFWKYAQPITDPYDVYLKLRREGDIYSGFYSFDGKAWEFIGELEISIKPVSYGLLIGKSDIPITAELDFFEFVQLP